MPRRVLRSFVGLLMLIAVIVAPAAFADTPPALPPEVSQYFGPVKDDEWAKTTVTAITRGLKDDQAKLVVINRAIAARIEHIRDQHPGIIPDKALWELGNGYCDNVSRLFVTLAKAAGYPARVISLTHTDGANGHIVAEAYYKGRWHVFDPDHGVEYYLPDGTVAGFEDLQKDQSPVLATKDPWTSRNEAGMEGFYRLPMKPHVW